MNVTVNVPKEVYEKIERMMTLVGGGTNPTEEQLHAFLTADIMDVYEQHVSTGMRNAWLRGGF